MNIYNDKKWLATKVDIKFDRLAMLYVIEASVFILSNQSLPKGAEDTFRLIGRACLKRLWTEGLKLSGETRTTWEKVLQFKLSNKSIVH